MIKLHKPIRRVTHECIRDRGKRRAIVASLIPGDVIELRMHGTSQRIAMPLVDLWWHGMKLKAEQLKRERAAARKAKRELNKLDINL